MFARAISTNRVKELNLAFKAHMGIDDAFAQVQSEQGSGKVWKPVAFHGFQCSLFSKTLNHTATRPQEPAINRVVHEVWPDSKSFRAEPVEPPIRSSGRKRKPTSRANEWAGASEEQQREYKRQYLRLWDIFHTVMKQMRCRDPNSEDLKDFGKNCRDLGARWCMMMPQNRCGALYLHTLMMHGGAFMEHLLPLKLTIGMLENSGAERRHQIGKVHFRKSLAGGGKQYSGMASHENRTAFLTMRGVLIWQFGRDMLAQEIARQEQAPTPEMESGRKRAAGGYSVLISQIAKPSRASIGLQNHPHPKATPPQDMDLDACDFLNQNSRLERLEDGCEMDLVEELAIEHDELRDVLDDDGGLQVKGGQYFQSLDFRFTADSDESSAAAGSEDQIALSGYSDSEISEADF
jgi:hypothetical protein